MTTDKETAKKQRSGIMLLFFALLPLTCITLAIAMPMLSAFSGLQKFRQISDNKAVIYSYQENELHYKKTINLIRQFISTEKKAELELSVDDLNALVNYHPSLAKMRGFIKFKKIIQAEDLYWVTLQADMSLPLDEILHEPNFYLNKQIDLALLVSHSTLIRDKEILFRLTQVYHNNKALNLELVNIWGEKNLIDLWINLSFPTEKSVEIKKIFDNVIKKIIQRDGKLIFKNYNKDSK